jgi:hypothetical protein
VSFNWNSPTINGKTTPMVGACNKNGVYYAWKQNTLAGGPVWSDQLGTSAAPPNNARLATATWDGSHFFITTNSSMESGASYPAVARELDPDTGAYLWQSGLSDGPVLGNTALDGAGVLAAVTFNKSAHSSGNELALIGSSSGEVLATYPASVQTGGGPVYADGYLLFGGSGGILHSYSISGAR